MFLKLVKKKIKIKFKKNLLGIQVLVEVQEIFKKDQNGMVVDLLEKYINNNKVIYLEEKVWNIIKDIQLLIIRQN